MADNFLDIVLKKQGSSDYEGDQYGGASGIDGSGLPKRDAGNFLFATGIECSYPTIQKGRKNIRRDMWEECGHYQRWQEDFALVREMGLRDPLKRVRLTVCKPVKRQIGA